MILTIAVVCAGAVTLSVGAGRIERREDGDRCGQQEEEAGGIHFGSEVVYWEEFKM